MVDWIMYSKIQEQKRNGLNKSQTAQNLQINRETVRTYWDMTPSEYIVKLENAKTRTKKADDYKDFVVECLTKYPDMSAAQIYDWIKEHCCLETSEFQERAFRNYVKGIRMEYGIKKEPRLRQYEAVDELPPGKQGQVDMGEISVETVGGRPREIVYDQDKILAVSENHGDIIYTEGFQNYLSEVKFDVFLCRGADPESKGKVENVVKYAKHGFVEHRIFTDIESFNADCIAWLKRTGNAKEHGTIKKIPAEVFAVEKEYLIPVPTYSFAATDKESISYQVRKDNIVLYKGNRYRVPKGTYAPGKKVFMVVNEEIISITDCLTGEIYATHPLCHEKGKLIGQKREERDKSKSLLVLEALIQGLFENDELVMPFLNHIHQDKPRYYRDQLGVIRKLFEEWNKEAVMDGLRYCSERELYSASDLKSSIIYLNQIREAKEPKKNKPTLPSKYRGNNSQKRDLSVYEQTMERSVVNG